jgi:indolepyruvate ferredoxin oxidoreductase
VLADDPGKYPRDAAFAPGVQVLPRERLDEVQRELRSVPGATVLVYDQTCATEARRRRKRGALPALQRHVFINEAVCEGCGDCSVKSNCLSVVPVETEFGTKRAIDPYSCNADLSCLEGECPALVSVEGAVPRRASGVPLDPMELPEPALPALNAAEPYSLLVAGTGGTGVVTLGALIGMAAHLEGKAVTVLDQTGLAQKGGAVLSHVRIAADSSALFAPRIVHADLLLGCDLLVAAAPATLERLRRGRTQAVINTAAAITGDQVRHPETGFPRDATLALLRERLGPADELDATRLASRLVGDAIATNMFMLGYAWQRGWLPVGRAALQRALELNGVAVDDNRRAFDWGRSAAVDRARAELRAAAVEAVPPSHRPSRDLDEAIARRRADLVMYQGERLAARYAALVEHVRCTEQQAAPGSERLALAVARQAHRLFAYKDEYEVARLYRTPAFDRALAAAFDGTPRLHLHLALPWRRQAAGAALRKQEFGPWMLRATRLLALGRHLRGTPFDPLGRSAERRMERALAADYVATVERLLLRLDAAHLDAAVTIAELPEGIRGYGSVKQRNARAVRERERELLARYELDAADTQPLAHAA